MAGEGSEQEQEKGAGITTEERSRNKRLSFCGFIKAATDSWKRIAFLEVSDGVFEIYPLII